MFYSNYDNYMQDYYCYNQMPNSRIGMYNPHMNMNTNYVQQQESFNNLYPNIYNIINPVVSRVLLGNNTQFLSEDSMKNLTDTIYSIVENQINIENENKSGSKTPDKNMTNANCSCNNNENSFSRRSDNFLIRDLIRILILKEFSIRRYQNFFPNPNMYNQPFFQPMYTY